MRAVCDRPLSTHCGPLMLLEHQTCENIIGNNTYMQFASELLRSVTVWTKGHLARLTQRRLSCRYS